jgi:hypothetical protein
MWMGIKKSLFSKGDSLQWTNVSSKSTISDFLDPIGKGGNWVVKDGYCMDWDFLKLSYI